MTNDFVLLREYRGELNKKDESIWVTKYFEAKEPIDTCARSLESLMKKLALKLDLIRSEKETSEDEKYVVWVLLTTKTLKKSVEKAKKTIDLVHYERFRGHFLDQKKQSYWVPVKKISSGEISVKEL